MIIRGHQQNPFPSALLDQLAVLVGESLPASLTTATARDAHRRALLKAAGVRSRQSGRPLVLTRKESPSPAQVAAALQPAAPANGALTAGAA